MSAQFTIGIDCGIGGVRLPTCPVDAEPTITCLRSKLSMLIPKSEFVLTHLLSDPKRERLIKAATAHSADIIPFI